MRTKALYYVTFLLFIVSAMSLAGCQRLSGPSDADVIKALNESGAFKDLTMHAPIEVIKKEGPRKDGSWQVQVKIKISYEIKDKKMSPIMEKTPIYFLVKSKDNAGHTVWKVKF
jgi:hypothetical protein